MNRIGYVLHYFGALRNVSVPSKGLLSKDFVVSKHWTAPFSTSRGTTLENVAFADDADKIVMQWDNIAGTIRTLSKSENSHILPLS